MVFVGMEGKLFHLYEHGHQAKLQALENVVQTPLDGHLIMNIVMGSFIWHFVEVAFIPTT